MLAGSGFAQVAPGNSSGGGPTATIVGQIQTATSGAINNGTLTFTLSQPAVVVGTASVVTQASSCYTSTQGNIVGLPDPQTAPVLSANMASGSLPVGTYYVELYYFNTAGGVSAVSPEGVITLTNIGTLTVAVPVYQPSSAAGYGIAIGLSSGGEMLQGTVTGFLSQYNQSTALVTGTAPQPVNTSSCNLYFSDQLEPTGTYYSVNLINKNGAQVSGFPQSWCTYGGAGGTINVSQGAPTGNCSTNGVFYPTPIFANLSNNGTQSINTPVAFPNGVSGSVNFSGPINFGSSINYCTGNTVEYVGGTCANAWGGGDIGAQINAAYFACPSIGCIIYVLPNSATLNSYDFTTPIAMTTASKPAALIGFTQGSDAIQLNYTATTGTAIQMDFTTPAGDAIGVKTGIENLTLTNNECLANSCIGGSATALVIGPNNAGVPMGRFENLRIIGFPTAISVTAYTSWGMDFENVALVANTTGYTNNGNSIENTTFHASKFTGNTTALSIGSGDTYIANTSIDQSYTVGINQSGGEVVCRDCHFEGQGTANSPLQFWLSTGGYSEIEGGIAVDDRTSGDSAIANWFEFGGEAFRANGIYLQSAGRTATQVFQADAGAVGFLNVANHSLTALATLVGGTDVLNVTNLSRPNSSSNNPIPIYWEAPHQALNVINGTDTSDSILQFGRGTIASYDVHILDVGTGGDGCSGSAKADLCLRADGSSNKVWLGVNGGGQFHVANTVTGGNNIPIVASLNTTNATSDTVALSGMTSSGHCSLTATNSTAASNIATTYVSNKTTNQITVTHTTTANMTYDVMCTPN